jgi:hypothetical protein
MGYIVGEQGSHLDGEALGWREKKDEEEEVTGYC